VFHPIANRASRAQAGLGAVAATLFLAGALSAARAADTSVPYVPTPQDVVERMLEIAGVGPRDYLIDLGSGDGRIVITAAQKFGSRGFGVDLNPVRIAEAQENARAARVTDRVSFYQQDLFETDLSNATVVTMYLLPRVNLELRPKLLELTPGVRIVSHDFSMGDWKPDVHETMDSKDKYGGAGGRSDIYLWIVPARVAGNWAWQLTVRGKPVRYELELEQRYQLVSGSARVNGVRIPLERAALKGGELNFGFTAKLGGEAIRHRFVGTVAQGSFIDGTAELVGPRLHAKQEWSASRAGRAAAPAAAALAR
jgi:hypothetical protein